MKIIPHRIQKKGPSNNKTNITPITDHPHRHHALPCVVGLPFECGCACFAQPPCDVEPWEWFI